MKSSAVSEMCRSDRYWRNDWADTERALAASTDKNLRAVYTELLRHYQRMADRYEPRGFHGIAPERMGEPKKASVWALSERTPT